MPAIVVSMSAPHVFDVTESDFQKSVVERSVTTPVLLDFWADWCEPCKRFTPVLEQLASEYNGAFVLGKVDAEAELALSQTFQVQSIPFVVLLVDGRPADAFAGALGEAELRAMLTRHRIEPATTAGDDDEPSLVPADEACLAVARQAARGGDAAAVRAALSGFPEESRHWQDHDNLLAGLEFLGPQSTVDRPAAADDAAATSEAGDHLDTARQHFLAGRYEAALRAIVASARADRCHGEGLARKAMLLCQGAIEDSELVDDYRRQLATLLY